MPVEIYCSDQISNKSPSNTDSAEYLIRGTKKTIRQVCASDEGYNKAVYLFGCLCGRTETVIRPTAAPMFNNRIIKIIDGRSFSSDDWDEAAAAPSVVASMLNGSIVGAGAAAAGAGALVLNQDGDPDMILIR